ncbi:SDR family NAD(P)-dependent oxidoreductase [Sphingoaurantiacus capsulatus]|uniref:SDR family NAD(P)-dependent oxidoreductase n=1 Tax=Sphingoaurantiacus capsulatus TaxID=1771310 RepID=A0ABV7XCE4_9SPHN
MTKTLEGKLVLVTGASRGIGAATALALGAAGAHVLLTARTEGGLEEVETKIHDAGGNATIAPLDLADSDGIDRLAQAIGGRWGRLDALLLNAAMLGDLMPVPHVPVAKFDQIMALNVGAPFRLIRAFDPLLRAADNGRVVALTSSLATAPRAYWGPYAASKAALEALVDTYGEEVRNTSRVRAAIVDPGRTRTKMRAQAYPGEDPQTVKPPEEVAEAIVKLLVEDFEPGARLKLGKAA